CELYQLLGNRQHWSSLLNRSSASSTDQTGGAAEPDGVGSPSILGSSKRMAESSNEGLRQAYGVVDHADLMMLRKRLARDRLLVRADEMADSELRDCTFKPKLVTRRRLSSNERSDESTSSPACGGSSRFADSHRACKRFEELYADGRTRDERLLGRAEAAIVAEREREAADCTFKPNIAASRISGEKVLQKKRPSGQQPLGYEAATTRLREATKKRQNLKQWRGGSLGIIPSTAPSECCTHQMQCALKTTSRPASQAVRGQSDRTERVQRESIRKVRGSRRSDSFPSMYVTLLCGVLKYPDGRRISPVRESGM
ncbi:hypothetical protein FOZ63_003762, partial [Perkinsus olseni]